MLEREPNSLVAAGAHAIASLCRGNPKSQIICSRALGSLVMHLESAVQNSQEGEEDHVVQEHLTDALFELSRNNKENKGILWRMHIVRLLIEILSNADASPVTHYNSLGILWEYSKNDNKGKLLAGNKHLTRLLDPLCGTSLYSSVFFSLLFLFYFRGLVFQFSLFGFLLFDRFIFGFSIVCVSFFSDFPLC
eukprot:Phypoly_transcript_16181.p1 GENE.Phypoly_transcript_16181~~Phypoly_transcript_16181.p1  ORF type:complete len:192 (+),score=36.23 Phypoly_transcript_16181:194-769(+)